MKKIILTENELNEGTYSEYETSNIEDYEKMISLYHVTPKSSVENIFNFFSDREFNAKNGNVYGAGVYTTPSIKESKTLLGSYGDSMIEFKLIGGFDRFLIFEEKFARKIYGDKWKLLDQLKTMYSNDVAIELYGKYRFNVKDYSKIAGKYNIRGAVYKWGSVIAVLPFDFTSLVPYAVSYDGGKTFHKKINDKTLERLNTSIDVEFKFGHKYKKIDKAIPGYNNNDEKTGFSRVLKKNGKYNYIDIQTGEEISPIDFDSATLMDPETGDFDIEYNGDFYTACPQGFFANDEEYELGKGHTFDELNSIKIMEKKIIKLTESDLHNIIQESVKNILKEYNNLVYYVVDEGDGDLNVLSSDQFDEKGYYNGIREHGYHISDFDIIKTFKNEENAWRYVDSRN